MMPYHLWDGVPLTYQQMNDNIQFMNDVLQSGDGAIAASAASAAQAAASQSDAASSASDAADSAQSAADALAQIVAYGNGWTPAIAAVSDGQRRVLQITAWTGGQGTPPETGYIGPTGIVSDIADATDFRGADGGQTIVQEIVYTESGTFDPADYPWAVFAVVKVFSGGASGSVWVAAAPTNPTHFYHGRAEGGRYEEYFIPLSALGVVDVIVGAGGAPVSSNTPLQGNSGGNSSFGDLVVLGGRNSTASWSYSSYLIQPVPMFGMQMHATDFTPINPTTVIRGGGHGGAGGRAVAGVSMNGGDGGNAAVNSSGAAPVGEPGKIPGGAGGAAARLSGSVSATSGAGARGEVRVILIGAN